MKILRKQQFFHAEHCLYRLLKIHRILEGDPSVGLLHITNGSAPQLLVLAFVDIGIVCDDLAQYIDVHALFENNRADALCVVIQRSCLLYTSRCV